jgi:hypothetical protein
MGDQTYIDVITGLPVPGTNFGFSSLTSVSNIQLTPTIARVLEVDISTTGKYLAMPNTLTLNNGEQWYIKNVGSTDFDIKDWSGAALIVTATAGLTYEVYIKDAETSAGSWGAMTFAGAGGSGGGLSSVGLSGPDIFVYTNNPLVANGLIGITLSSQVSNTVLAGPATGSAASPTFRTLSNSDLPVMVGDAGAGGVKGAAPAPSAGDAAANKFLSAAGTWATPSGSGAPASASYVVISAEASLIAERILQVGSALSLTDNGAGSSVVIGLDGDLVAVAALNGQGLATRIAVDTWTTRSIQVSGSALSISDAAGVAGNPTLGAAATVESLATNTSTGLLVQSGTVIISRLLTVSGSAASWVNSTGSAGNPTLVFDTDIEAIAALSQSGLATRLSATSWTTREISTVSSRIVVTNSNGYSGNPFLDLAVTAVSAGTYSAADISVDAYGRVTYAAANTSLSSAIAALSAAQAMTFIGTYATSGTVTGLTISGLSTNYLSYQFTVSSATPSVSGADLWMRFSSDNGATFVSTGYHDIAILYVDTSTSPAISVSTAASKLLLAQAIGNTVDFGANGEVVIINPTVTGAFKKIQSTIGYLTNASLLASQECRGGLLSTTSMVNAVQFIPSTGNLAMSVNLYGLRAT